MSNNVSESNVAGRDVCVLRVFTLILGSKKAAWFFFIYIYLKTKQNIDLAYMCYF